MNNQKSQPVVKCAYHPESDDFAIVLTLSEMLSCGNPRRNGLAPTAQERSRSTEAGQPDQSPFAPAGSF